MLVLFESFVCSVSGSHFKTSPPYTINSYQGLEKAWGLNEKYKTVIVRLHNSAARVVYVVTHCLHVY